MNRTLLVTVLLALLAVPLAVAQHGPPPGYTDPNDYAQDYAADQAAQAQADPVGYATGKDPANETQHTLWLACWEAYAAADHALDAVCSRYFTAPGTVQPTAEDAHAEVTEVVNGTGATALLNETLDAVNDTVADPAGAAGQVARIVDAVVGFVEGIVDFVKGLLGVGLDASGLAGLAVLAGAWGALQGLVDLAGLPLDGLHLAGDGLATASGALAAALGALGSAGVDAASAAGRGLVDGVQAVLGTVADAGHAAADGAATVGAGLAAAVGAVGSGLTQAAQGVADGAQATAHGIGKGIDAVGHGVRDAVHRIGSLLDGKPAHASDPDGKLSDAPKTGTDADGLLDRLLGSL